MKKLSVFALALLFFISVFEENPPTAPVTLARAVENSPDLNVKDGFFYNILYDGGGLLCYNMALCLSGEVHSCLYEKRFSAAKIKRKNLEKHEDEILSNRNMCRELSFYDRESLLACAFGGSVSPIDNTRLREKRAESGVKRYIEEIYGLRPLSKEGEQKKKAAAFFASFAPEETKIEYTRLKTYPAFTYALAEARYTVEAKKDGVTRRVRVCRYYLLSSEKAGIGYDFKVVYCFIPKAFPNFDFRAFCKEADKADFTDALSFE